MKNENYTASITTNISANDAFNVICKVDKWWSKNIEGNTKKLNDIYTYRPGNTWVTIQITECVPGKKIVWHVTDCFLHFQNDKTEWKNTKMVFEISEDGNGTQINFTHIGLVPEVECYAGCVKGWDHYFRGSLLKLLTTGTGQPD